MMREENLLSFIIFTFYCRKYLYVPEMRLKDVRKKHGLVPLKFSNSTAAIMIRIVESSLSIVCLTFLSHYYYYTYRKSAPDG